MNILYDSHRHTHTYILIIMKDETIDGAVCVVYVVCVFCTKELD